MSVERTSKGYWDEEGQVVIFEKFESKEIYGHGIGGYGKIRRKHLAYILREIHIHIYIHRGSWRS